LDSNIFDVEILIGLDPEPELAKAGPKFDETID
jgi:hypothetical protein